MIRDPYGPIPRFGTHVIRGLTVKFNHNRVKVYHLHVFCLAKVESGLVHCFLYSAAAAKVPLRVFYSLCCRTH